MVRFKRFRGSVQVSKKLKRFGLDLLEPLPIVKHNKNFILHFKGRYAVAQFVVAQSILYGPSGPNMC